MLVFVPWSISNLHDKKMKILKRNISAKDGSGTVVLRCEVPEDLWHLYNMLQEKQGDRLKASTMRKVTTVSSTGSTNSNKKRLNLTVEVYKVEFDPESEEIRASGPNRQENEFVKLGAYHTLTVTLDMTFTIEKLCWDQIFLERLDEASNPERNAEIAAVVMSSNGLAHVCLITSHMTLTKQRIDVNIPKKRAGSSNHSKAVKKFFDAIYRSVLQYIDFHKIKCVIIASPGYVKDDFWKFFLEEAVRREDRPFILNKSKFILTRASSGHKHALQEVFEDVSIQSKLADTRFSQEVQILNKFMRMIDINPDKAYYGYSHVNQANEEMAIDHMMITDELFRSKDIATRKKYVALVESVRERGGRVYVFSTLHVSGIQLQQVSGIAAILRYPLPDLAELEDISEQQEYDDDSDDEYQQQTAFDRVQNDIEDMGF